MGLDCRKTSQPWLLSSRRTSELYKILRCFDDRSDEDAYAGWWRYYIFVALRCFIDRSNLEAYTGGSEREVAQLMARLGGLGLVGWAPEEEMPVAECDRTREDTDRDRQSAGGVCAFSCKSSCAGGGSVLVRGVRWEVGFLVALG